MTIEIVSSPRPEDDNQPLPTYHELLEYLCQEFQIPGSPTFWSAVQFIKDRYVLKNQVDVNVADSESALIALYNKISSLRKAAEERGEKMFLGIPEYWYKTPKYRCTQGHISTYILLTETGDRCLACHQPLMLTFPEDEEGTLL